jgi:MarR family transcriptional regulator, 2-MHQ and catechol-resistance regulon repressor
MDLIEELSRIEDPVKDHSRILGNLYFTHFWLLDRYKAILDNYGITPQQSNVLAVVKEFHPRALTLTEVKAGLLEKNADVSRIITRLTSKGLLKRKINRSNKRKVEISITEKGRRLMDKMERDDPFQKFTSKFTLEDARTLVGLLNKLRVE